MEEHKRSRLRADGDSHVFQMGVVGCFIYPRFWVCGCQLMYRPICFMEADHVGMAVNWGF
jgi:hypothetical protein